MQKINFKSRGEDINGTLFVPSGEGKHPGVIFFHGSGSSEKNYLPMAQALYEKGFTTLTVNFRGHENLDNLSMVTANDGVADGLSAYDFFIKQRCVDTDRVGICGGSFGGMIATYVSEQRKVKSMLLRAPAVYNKEMMTKNMAEVLLDESRIFNDMKHVEDSEVIKNISKYNGNLCIVAAENDELIPAWLTNAIFNSAQKATTKEMKVIKNSPHRMIEPAQRKQLLEIITEWFMKTL